METKDLEPILTGITEIKAEQKNTATLATEAKNAADGVKAVAEEAKTAAEEVKTTVGEIKAWQVKKDEADAKNQEALDKLLLKGKNGGGHAIETKSFNDILADTIVKNANNIKKRKKFETLELDMLPEVKAEENGEREVKAVGDMSISANFPAAQALYQDVRSLVINPYNRVWLGDVLPGGSSTGSQLIYPKENGQEGAAGVWNPGSDKAQIDFDLKAETVPFKWIAGYVIVEREMLDDIPFLTSYLQSKMLIALKTAENQFILQGDDTGTVVPGLQDVASVYNGEYNDRVRRIVDAAYGQIVDATSDFYQGNLTIMNARDAVKVGLNQATGSGEFDLPEGSVAFSAGKLALAGLQNVTTSVVPQNTFYALDKSATLFVRRMQPELRLFEDATLAKRNKVMWRIEERVTLAIFNNAAIVKGILQTS
jgi:hypothetical protein